ncbi:MAG: protein-glutamate O-methyltransferase CheR [Planctomycetaceae bacterium]
MALATKSIEFIRDLVEQQSGNVISPRQSYMLEQRLAPMAETMGLDDVEGLVNELRRTRNPKLSTDVAEAVTVNETSFFRDMHVFQALQKKILPDVIARNQQTKTIRIWSAASSSGQEPISIGMVIREHFPELSNWKIKIVATDLSEAMLTKCRSGQYSQMEVNRGLPVAKLVKFFSRNGSTWQVKPEVLGLIDYKRMNLTKPWSYMGQFDVVLIRNVLIYFELAAKADILQRVRGVLHPGGYLFIGAAETMIGMGAQYQREEIDATVCYRPKA